MVALVVVARNARIEDKAREVAPYEHLNITRTPPHHADARSGEFILGTLAHIASQHHLYAHIVERRSNVALTATSLWRGEGFGSRNSIILNRVDGVVVAVTEVVINAPITCRYCNFHIFLSNQFFNSQLILFL